MFKLPYTVHRASLEDSTLSDTQQMSFMAAFGTEVEACEFAIQIFKGTHGKRRVVVLPEGDPEIVTPVLDLRDDVTLAERMSAYEAQLQSQMRQQSKTIQFPRPKKS